MDVNKIINDDEYKKFYQTLINNNIYDILQYAGSTTIKSSGPNKQDQEQDIDAIQEEEEERSELEKKLHEKILLLQKNTRENILKLSMVGKSTKDIPIRQAIWAAAERIRKVKTIRKKKFPEEPEKEEQFYDQFITRLATCIQESIVKYLTTDLINSTEFTEEIKLIKNKQSPERVIHFYVKYVKTIALEACIFNEHNPFMEIKLHLDPSVQAYSNNLTLFGSISVKFPELDKEIFSGPKSRLLKKGLKTYVIQRRMAQIYNTPDKIPIINRSLESDLKKNDRLDKAVENILTREKLRNALKKYNVYDVLKELGQFTIKSNNH